MKKNLHIGKKGICLTTIITVIVLGSHFAYSHWFAPTRILVVNALPAVEADIQVNNPSRHIKISIAEEESTKGFDDPDAVLLYGRGLHLSPLQQEKIDKLLAKGIPVFTYALINYSNIIRGNITEGETDTLQNYCLNPCRPNYINLLLYLRHIATPQRLFDRNYEAPVDLPSNMYYHVEPGRYFKTPEGLTGYLKEKGIYNEGGQNVAFVSGVTFPVEGSRPYIDTLLNRLTAKGFNLYPLTASGADRAAMIKELKPDAVIYFPMGRFGNDEFITWLNDQNIPLFTPFPLLQSHEEWIDRYKLISGGAMNARVLIPEVDGGIDPLCIATQNPIEGGLLVTQPEIERIDAFTELFSRHMALRTKPARDKKVAICIFRNPGKDVMHASGMEVAPSLYAVLLKLRQEGYNVSGLPSSAAAFEKEINEYCCVLGEYASAAQEKLMNSGRCIFISKEHYLDWCRKQIQPEKYKEVEELYGPAPGRLLARGDSIAVAALQYGNILIFPQPRSALGDNEFKIQHGVDQAPPHSYLAPYLYVKNGFMADAIYHFGTHGNLEYTPGKNIGLSGNDWPEALLGNLPHFYLYTTGNVGEGIIAKRRSHAVLNTYLTPPFVESGMRSACADLLSAIHNALAAEGCEFDRRSIKAKAEIVKRGYHRALQLDSTLTEPYSREDLEKADTFVEELANEKITGAYYVMGTPYSQRDLVTTVEAMHADAVAYGRASKDCSSGKITEKELKDFTYITQHYLPKARTDVAAFVSRMPASASSASEEMAPAAEYYRLLKESPSAELSTVARCLEGGSVYPAPGGDPVLNGNVLPTGRNMFSINVETTPTADSWNDGVRLAEATIESHLKATGEYPKKIGYTFWAGEFICSEGATIAQALHMLGVEPVRDGHDRVIDLRLVPSAELGRPRIDVTVQISGQLRDIAASRLKLITEGVKLASEAKDDIYPNYVAEGTEMQLKQIVTSGESPVRAKELSTMRVFGPVNSGYSTGMMGYTEHSGEWEDESELAEGYFNNMCAMYGDEENWGAMSANVMKSAFVNTEMIVQPRQSNTWGPLSLDHVYEFTGAMSLAVKEVTGKEPRSVMADYRNRYMPRLQDTRQAIAVESYATILNPVYVKERMSGGATTAAYFAEIFRNVFGWSALRRSALDPELYDKLYDMYVADVNGLGIEKYFSEINPAAYQEMTGTMMESARKGYWEPSEEQLKTVAEKHAEMTRRYGAPCSEFVCGNAKLQSFISSNLTSAEARTYEEKIAEANEKADRDGVVLKKEKKGVQMIKSRKAIPASIAVILAIAAVIVFFAVKKEKR